jgi:hypothetical protein
VSEQKRLYTTILIKRRVSGDPGPPSYLAPGELAFNESSQTLSVGSFDTQTSTVSAEEF